MVREEGDQGEASVRMAFVPAEKRELDRKAGFYLLLLFLFFVVVVVFGCFFFFLAPQNTWSSLPRDQIQATSVTQAATRAVATPDP